MKGQGDLLEKVVERAKRSPFYGNRLNSTFASTAMTMKADLRRASPFGMLAVPKQALATYHESSGTSGIPTSSFFTDQDWQDITTRFLRNAANIVSTDSVLVKTPYSMVTTAHQMHQAARMRGALVVPADNRSTNMPYSKVIRLLKQVPITIAWCMPTELVLWAKTAALLSRDPQTDFPSLRGFFVAGEPLSGAKQKRLESLWGGKRVYQDYGSTETGSLAGQCPLGQMHLWADRVYCEVYDPKKKELKTEGRGVLVVTPLYRQAMPLLRYCLEDTVEISHEDCACDWKLPTIRILGRSESSFIVQGRLCYPMDLDEIIYSLPLELGVCFWRARHQSNDLAIEIESAGGKGTEACKLLGAEIYQKLGVYADVQAVRDEIASPEYLLTELPFMKPRYVFGPNEDWKQGIHY